MTRLPLPTSLVATVCAAILPCPVLAAEPSVAPPGLPLAVVEFTEATQSYAGRPYLFLGDGSLEFSIAVPAQAGHALDLLWGAKQDLRSASLTFNGRSVTVQTGGFDGFRWVRVAVPPGLQGPYTISAAPAHAGRPAFFAAVRLVSTGANTPTESSPPTRISYRRLPAPPAEAFPDMRPLWDRVPAPAQSSLPPEVEARFRAAEQNARFAAEGLYRCRRYVDGWLAHADPKTGLIPRNLTAHRDLWNGRDAAADNYPYMVLTCAITDPALFNGRMREMLRTEERLTRRLDRLGDDYSFGKGGFAREQLQLDALIFDNAEYVKDGLIPLTEWLGASPWSERMIGLVEDIWKHAPVETPYGKIPTLNVEVNGDLLQACSRLFWFTGQRKFLDWAMRLGDFYLLGTNHPTRDFAQLRLIDHGCEILNGLSELYVGVRHAAPDKRQVYEPAMRAMFDRILEIARNEHGLLYTWINPKSGEHAPGLCDTWGYDYDAFYTFHLMESVPRYRDAVRQALGHLDAHYRGWPWADRSADGHADAIEGAINLFAREPVPSAAQWIDAQTRLMWSIQKPDGVIEGWHGDGNFARTTIMHALWKTQGLHVQPWRADVRIGAVREGTTVSISVTSDQPWSGRIVFDRPRHRLDLHLPVDYPRINQYPEWFTVEPDRKYAIQDVRTKQTETVSGENLIAGWPLELKPGVEQRLEVRAR